LFYFLEKRNKVVEKKPAVEIQIKLANIPLVLENLAPKIDPMASVKRVSPSPSNKVGYGKSSQMYDNRVRVSPSPPSNKLPGQNIIGFNQLNQSQSQYGNQPLPSNSYAQNSNPLQVSKFLIQGNSQGPMGVSNIPGFDQSGVSKNMPYESQQVTAPLMDRPVYPNPYYATNQIQKSSSV
jgi:hypothetical protein